MKSMLRNGTLIFFCMLAGWVEGRIATSGGGQSINRIQTSGNGKTPYRHSHNSGYRAVYDLGNPKDSRYSLVTGQSGNPFSAGYMEQLTANCVARRKVLTYSGNARNIKNTKDKKNFG
ncbi:MAG: hypothetical protein CFH10_01451 [Alphaproteobacteria bacterium MarineAlpha4_Bin2]|nr:MAG: hypothetical protein CFH10_01451 [Alphaproteobacteria bacterium MarineAlpha4_Bin2]